MLKLFHMRLPAGDSREGLLAEMRRRVPPSVWEEASAFRNRAVALRRLAGEAMVAACVRRCWGIGRDAYAILRPPGGKPRVDGCPGVHFNLSHSGDYVLCALSDAEVGVDIERRAAARLAVARRFFHPAELADLERLSGPERDARFFDYWSAKEAFLKYLGAGLARPLASFRVEFAGEPLLWEGAVRLPLRLRACPVDAAYACHLCTPLDEPVEILPFAL